MPAIEFEGHAIVSADGMIARADGSMPPELHNDADWRLFQAALDRAALVVLGRIGHARHPNPGRRRLVLTRSVTAFAPDPADPLAVLWNPGGARLEQVLDSLAIRQGIVAITGGTGTFNLFAPLFDRFQLVEVTGLRLPGGTPCFSGGEPRAVLAANGLGAGPGREIDKGVMLTNWARLR